MADPANRRIFEAKVSRSITLAAAQLVHSFFTSPARFALIFSTPVSIARTLPSATASLSPITVAELVHGI